MVHLNQSTTKSQRNRVGNYIRAQYNRIGKRGGFRFELDAALPIIYKLASLCDPWSNCPR